MACLVQARPVGVDFVNPLCLFDSYWAVPSPSLMLSIAVGAFFVFGILGFLERTVSSGVSFGAVGTSYDPPTCPGYMPVALALVTLSKLAP